MVFVHVHAWCGTETATSSIKRWGRSVYIHRCTYASARHYVIPNTKLTADRAKEKPMSERMLLSACMTSLSLTRQWITNEGVTCGPCAILRCWSYELPMGCIAMIIPCHWWVSRVADSDHAQEVVYACPVLREA